MGKLGPAALKESALSFDIGMTTLIHAFNLTNDPAHGYRFPGEVCARAQEKLKELYARL